MVATYIDMHVFKAPGVMTILDMIFSVGVYWFLLKVSRATPYLALMLIVFFSEAESKVCGRCLWNPVSLALTTGHCLLGERP